MLLKRTRVIKGCNYGTVVHVCLFFLLKWHSFSLETRVFNVAFTHLIPSVSMVELTVEKIKFKGISKI